MKNKSVFVFFAVVSLFVTSAFAKDLLVGVVETCQTGIYAKVSRTYIKAVESAGFTPVVIPLASNDKTIDEFIDRIDILLLTGGEDVEPAKYGEKNSPRLGKVNLQRDSFEWRLLTAAKKVRRPIFGICRGEQILNVFFGGTLYQDIPSEFPRKKGVDAVVHSTAWQKPIHKVTVVPSTRLAAVVGEGEMLVNTYHHQAVKDLAPGFIASAYAPDGVIEAIESIDYPAAGVQFHPEIIIYRDDSDYSLPKMTEIFARLPELVAKEPLKKGTKVLSDILTATDDETLLKAFISIPSESKDIDGCNRMSEAMAAHLRAHGLKCTLEKMPNGRKVLFACSRDTKKPDVLLSAHLDVVKPQSPSMYTATVTNGVLYGRGASDCKGHCVLSARLLRELKDKVSIGCIFGSDEEIGGYSTKYLVDELGYGAKKVIFVFDMEPYSITTRQKGLGGYTVTCNTKAMHTGLMKGKIPKNSLDIILEGRAKLAQLLPDYEDGSWRDTAKVSSINGGGTKTVAKVFVKNSKNNDWSDIEAKLAQAFPGCKIESYRKSPAVILDESDPVLNEFLRRTKVMCDRKGFKYDGFFHLDSSTDARHLQYMGLPMIITGTDCHGGHTEREHMILSSMQDYFELVSEFILDNYKEKK